MSLLPKKHARRTVRQQLHDKRQRVENLRHRRTRPLFVARHRGHVLATRLPVAIRCGLSLENLGMENREHSLRCAQEGMTSVRVGMLRRNELFRSPAYQPIPRCPCPDRKRCKRERDRETLYSPPSSLTSTSPSRKSSPALMNKGANPPPHVTTPSSITAGWRREPDPRPVVGVRAPLEGVTRPKPMPPRIPRPLPR